MFRGRGKPPKHDYEKMVGTVIGKWKIISSFVKRYRLYFNVECECGRKSEPTAYHVAEGYSKECLSCAPLHHGLIKTPEYRSWSGARNRCYNKNNKDYNYYGGRGIKMCDRWQSFENFLADMGSRPPKYTLDRIDNNGDYCHKNCRWATISQQNSNQRKRYSSTLSLERI